MSREEIILIGAGGHCRSCIDVIEQEGRFDIGGLVERPNVPERSLHLGYPVIGTDKDLRRLRERFSYALVTVGQIKTSETRVRLYDELLSLGFDLPTIVSPSAYVSPHSRVGMGTIVMHQALINAGAIVGANCIINSKVLVEHDATIGDHCHLSTGVIINGQTVVGKESFIGSNSVCKEGLVLREKSIIRFDSWVSGSGDQTK
jgi:sugar O-acyltransferase (sialic acid O-acetyltransferase NeuD family)